MGRQYIVVTLSPRGIADFAENGGQAAVGFEAVKQADRINGQPPATGLGEQTDASLRRVTKGLFHALAHCIAQAHTLTRCKRQVVSFAEGEGGPARMSGE